MPSVMLALKKSAVSMLLECLLQPRARDAATRVSICHVVQHQ